MGPALYLFRLYFCSTYVDTQFHAFTPNIIGSVARFEIVQGRELVKDYAVQWLVHSSAVDLY
jgi:hypothetical protein